MRVAMDVQSSVRCSRQSDEPNCDAVGSGSLRCSQEELDRKFSPPRAALQFLGVHDLAQLHRHPDVQIVFLLVDILESGWPIQGFRDCEHST